MESSSKTINDLRKRVVELQEEFVEGLSKWLENKNLGKIIKDGSTLEEAVRELGYLVLPEGDAWSEIEVNKVLSKLISMGYFVYPPGPLEPFTPTKSKGVFIEFEERPDSDMIDYSMYFYGDTSQVEAIAAIERVKYRLMSNEYKLELENTSNDV